MVARLAWPIATFNVTRKQKTASSASGENPGWASLPRPARIYVALVIVVGAAAFIASTPFALPNPALFITLLFASCLTSVWKVSLPIPMASGSTLSVSYAANLMSLLLLGPRYAVIIAVAGVWTQCGIGMHRPYQRYRTVFSVAAEAVTMLATGIAYEMLGGVHSQFDVAPLARPLAGAIATYFVMNTGLIAGAIALSTGRSTFAVWRDEFLWSVSSFFVAGSAGAAGALLIDRDQEWLALFALAPIYLTYWTYRVFVGRLDDQERHLAQVRQAERALAIEKAGAEQANRVKDQFLAIVSHELRTPLNAIVGWSDMLRSGSLDETRRGRAVHAICDSARHQAQLIDELLDVSRIISGKLRLDLSPVDWQQIVRSALEVTQPAATAKRIDVTVDADPAIGTFNGDGARLQQVVWNLLINAVKFTPEGGGVHIRLRRIDNHVELSVTDTGIGMSPEFVPHVFEPFRQADGSSTRRQSGLGLGLSIVKRLVEMHGGSIRAASAGEGQGSTFSVVLPIVTSDDTPGAIISDDPALLLTPTTAFSSSLDGVTVLVVDDDAASREVAAAYLEACGAKVQQAGSVDEGIDRLRDGHMDVLLSDIAMPGHDGYELIRRVRAMSSTATATIPAAALTAYARAEDRKRALDAGFQLHLTKPISQRALVDAVARLSRATPSGHTPSAQSAV